MLYRLLLFLLLVCSASAAERKFDYSRDTFAFSNETLWIYSIDAQGGLHMQQRDAPPEYARHCFVMCRGAIEFYRFVRFDPSLPKVSEAEYVKRIRHICRIPVWMPAGKKVVIPGFSDLRTFSKAYQRDFLRELGKWWPSYFRFGNWRMAMPFPRVWQKALAKQISRKLDKNEIQAVFMTRFKPINHCVVAYDYKQLPNGDVRFLCYDPNYAKASTNLIFQQKDSSFFFERTPYFNGGRVNCFSTYVAPWK